MADQKTNNQDIKNQPDYSKWLDIKDKCIKDYKKNKITLQERAEILTKGRIWHNNTFEKGYYEQFIQLGDYINLNGVYDDTIDKLVVLKLFIVFNKIHENAIDQLLEEVKISEFKKNKKNDYIIYEFIYKIKRNNVIGETNYYIKDILDPDSSYFNTMNIPRFIYLIGRTPAKRLFVEINNQLIEPYNKLEYTIFLAINNGCEIYTWGSLLNLISEKHINRYFPDLKKVMRSSWEANIARLLNYKNIPWEYELKRFELKTHHKIEEYNTRTNFYQYLPDFFLEKDKIIEVKGFWDKNSIEILNCFKNEYKDIKILVVDYDMYYTLEKLYRNIIHNWERTKVKIKSTNIPIVGINRPERKQFVKALKIGDSVTLERDNLNPYDTNAIKVLDENGNMVGFMAKEWASIYADKMDLGMKFETRITSKEQNVLSVEVRRRNLSDDAVYEIFKLK